MRVFAEANYMHCIAHHTRVPGARWTMGRDPGPASHQVACIETDSVLVFFRISRFPKYSACRQRVFMDIIQSRLRFIQSVFTGLTMPCLTCRHVMSLMPHVGRVLKPTLNTPSHIDHLPFDDGGLCHTKEKGQRSQRLRKLRR